MKKHRVFVSFYHKENEVRRDEFLEIMCNHADCMINESVEDGEIPENSKKETVFQWIREKCLVNASVTVVLIGPNTWKRKWVDWEIYYTLRETNAKKRGGLLGILLPEHPDFGEEGYDEGLIPPRLSDNLEERVEQKEPYAELYDWSTNELEIMKWIHDAFLRRRNLKPHNSRKLFKDNRHMNMKRWNTHG